MFWWMGGDWRIILCPPTLPLPHSTSILQKWLSKKTSGLGYTMALYKSGLGASVLVSLSPFFFGLRRPPRVASMASATALGSAQLLMDGSDDVNAASPVSASVAAAAAEGPTVVAQGPALSPPLESPTPAGDAKEEEEDEIPVPVLANGQQEEGEGDGEEEGGEGASAMKNAADGAADDDHAASSGDGEGGGGGGAAPGGESPSSSSSPAPSSSKDAGQHDGGLGGEAAGANTIGVA